MKKCEFASCGKPFHVIEHKLGMPGTREKEPITCPYCDHTIERMTDGWWHVAAATEKEISDFENQ
jgi:DNA-directed RNA polymerase subunit RPC12/RpoP